MTPGVFDRPHALEFNLRRKTWLTDLLRLIREGQPLNTAIDVGCGVGHFSGFLHDLGFTVTAIDGRNDNIEEAKKRFPTVRFETLNIEDPKIINLGSFDIVLCIGLLYHLENPFRAIRNLRSLTEKYLIVESMIAPSRLPIAVLQKEVRSDDQGLDHIAFLPSETSLVKMLYRSGFQYVYKTKDLPDHPDFKKPLFTSPTRTFLVASDTPLTMSQFAVAPDPKLRGVQRSPLWYVKLRMTLGRLIQIARRIIPRRP